MLPICMPTRTLKVKLTCTSTNSHLHSHSHGCIGRKRDSGGQGHVYGRGGYKGGDDTTSDYASQQIGQIITSREIDENEVVTPVDIVSIANTCTLR